MASGLVFVAWCVLVSVGFVVASSGCAAGCVSVVGGSISSCLLGVGLVVRVLIGSGSFCGVSKCRVRSGLDKDREWYFARLCVGRRLGLRGRMGVLLCAARMFAVVLAAWSINSLLGWKLWMSCGLAVLWFLRALWRRLH